MGNMKPILAALAAFVLVVAVGVFATWQPDFSKWKSEDSEHCYPKSHFIDQLKFEGKTEMEVFTAVIEKNTDHFWCAANSEIGLKGEGTCGTMCDDYSPRNGKNGRCRFSKNCYVWGEKVTIKLKQQTK